ncbi:MAG TPA: DUF6456 domain-containing protein [Rhizomicrobium sp.]|jgi:hypothetical protein
MNANAVRTGRCPPLPVEKRSKPYEPLNGQAGHDGEPPVHGERKTLTWEEGKRVAGVSPFNLNHSRACYLHSRGRIDARQFAAAERLYKDWQLSQIQPRASSVMVGGGSSGGDNHPNDTKVDAMRRHGAAIAALGAAAPLMELVILRDMSVEKSAAQLQMHAKYAHGALWVALHFLADHYGLPKGA